MDFFRFLGAGAGAVSAFTVGAGAGAGAGTGAGGGARRGGALRLDALDLEDGALALDLS